MDDQNQNLDQNPALPGKARTGKRVWVIAIAVGVLIILIGGWFVWNNYLSPNAQRTRNLQENIDKYNSFVNTYEAAMKADTYGGKTPQETLNMFVDALKKGDIDLASKYFALDTNENSPDYLTRKKWESALNDPSLKPNLNKIADSLLKAVPDIKNISAQNDYKFGNYILCNTERKNEPLIE